MPRYAYTAIDRQGKRISGSLSAPTELLARAELSNRELQPVKFAIKKSVFVYEITRKKIKRPLVMSFSRQLGVFVRSGVPIIEALRIIESETTNKAFREVLTEMTAALLAGDSFTNAARAHPNAFPPYYIGMLESAELAGNLDEVLTRLSTYMERDADARSKVVGAMIYPGVILAVAIVVVGVLCTYVMPKFVTFFNSLNAKLPLVTRMLIDIASFFGKSYLIIFGIIIVIVVGLVLSRKVQSTRLLLDSFVLRLPIMGDMVRHIMVERICRILSAMTESGVGLPEAIAVSAESVSSLVFKRGLEHIHTEMLAGHGLAGPVAASGIMPTAARQMIRVGEETGTLVEQLRVAASFYERELEVKTKRFTSLFEPIVIVCMGVIVGFVAIALISAMYGIYRQINVNGAS
jgi:type IV pilus assembly protein PilC